MTLSTDKPLSLKATIQIRVDAKDAAREMKEILKTVSGTECVK